jgi:hypothetical protein
MHVKLVVRIKFTSLFIIWGNFRKSAAHLQSESTIFHEVLASVYMTSKSVPLLMFIAISFTRRPLRIWILKTLTCLKTTFIKGKRYNKPITGLDRPWGLQEVVAPRFQDNRHMKVERWALKMWDPVVTELALYERTGLRLIQWTALRWLFGA